MVRKFIFFAILLTLILSGCKITKYIGEEEQLLMENKIEFSKKAKIVNKGTLKTELETLYKQVPNEKQLGFFKLGAYLHIKLKETEQDTAKETSLEKSIRKIVGRRFAEPPSIFDENLMDLTKESMVYYLQNRGYFDAEVDVSVNIPPEKSAEDEIYFEKDEERQVISKKIEVTYIISPNRLYEIDDVEFLSKDTAIHQIINEVADRSFLKKGEPVDGRLYDLEVNRITSVLRNKGYAYFTPNYVGTLEGDTTNYKAKLKLEILTPGRAQFHEKYKFGEVRIFPEFNLSIDSLPFTDTLIGGFHFLKYANDNFFIRPEVLLGSVFLSPGAQYNYDLITKTQRALSDLGAYRFVNIRSSLDTGKANVINFEILLTPRKKWEIGYDIEPNFTERQQQNDNVNLFGFSTSAVLGNKNLFRGAEHLNSNAFLGFEFGKAELNAIEIKQQNDVNIPRFIDYLGLFKGVKKLGLLSDEQFSSVKNQAKTRIRLGYNYLHRVNFYTQHVFNASFGYDLQGRYNRLLVNNLAVDYVNPTSIGDLFRAILDGNPFLENSFGAQLFTGLFFRDISYTLNSRSNRFGENHYYRFGGEISGLEVYTANEIYNAVTGNNVVFRADDSVEFSQYAKVDLEAGYSRKFNPKHSIAFRMNLGIGTPFGRSSEVPYVKQFYAGGPQSIRAWAARGIGPGSFADSFTLVQNNSIFFYQTGDFKLEVNAEYRIKLFKLFADVEMAFFADAGNVWTLKKDLNRPGSQLSWNKSYNVAGELTEDNFFREIAVGSGIGFRFDFSYFLLRFDIGYPIKNAYRRSVGTDRYTYLAIRNADEFLNSYKLFNYNLGVNYPF